MGIIIPQDTLILRLEKSYISDVSQLSFPRNSEVTQFSLKSSKYYLAMLTFDPMRGGIRLKPFELRKPHTESLSSHGDTQLHFIVIILGKEHCCYFQLVLDWLNK
jgi:hypothetical protein